MKNKIIKPKDFLSKGNEVKCVYKLVFKYGYYYIGATSNLKTRISAHKAVLNGLAAFYRSCYRDLLHKEIMYVVVIETGGDINSLRKIESAVIKECKLDKKLLNKRMGKDGHFLKSGIRC